VSERNYNLLDIIGGVRQYDYYATLGEKGMTNGICTQEKLANVRLQELKRVGKLFNKTLIVPDPNHLVFHDGQLLEQIDDLTNDILYHMKAIKPTRVFSFPPSGITGHPDHIAMFLAGWRALQTYVQQTDHPIRFYCRVIPTWARGIEGADKYSNLIKHDKLRPTHYVDARPFAHLHLQNLLAHETQQPALSTIFPVLRSPENRGHEFEYYSLVYERR
jgi:LmbE family N-acetylglucosaminyl deacetylase